VIWSSVNFATKAKLHLVSPPAFRFLDHRYVGEFPDFPSALPTFKWVLRNWAAKQGIPRKPGPAPSVRPTAPE
jgi:hypothetical protein